MARAKVLFISERISYLIILFVFYFVKLDAWALVTGSSEGIGKGIAEALAMKGFNIVLLSRNESKLLLVAQELKAKYKIETKIIAVDVSADNYVWFYWALLFIDRLKFCHE